MQREVTDDESTTWTCVQAYAGLGGSAAATEAAERVAERAGAVAVTCTPRGGAQSVRLELAPGWDRDLSDEQLLQEIGKKRD